MRREGLVVGHGFFSKAVNASAFMKFDASGAASQTVDFVFDAVPGGGFGAASGANAGPFYTSGTASTVAGALKVKVSVPFQFVSGV